MNKTSKTHVTTCDDCMKQFSYDTNYLNEDKEIRCPNCNYLAYKPNHHEIKMP